MKKYIAYILITIMFLLSFSACSVNKKIEGVSKTQKHNIVLQRNVFDEIADKSFIFSSGAGGWSTEITINVDGEFSGNYTDQDTMTSDEKPIGVIYNCQFTGKFIIKEQKDDYTYILELEELDILGPQKETVYENKKIIPSDPYGIIGGKTFELYLPGKIVSDLPEEYLMWLPFTWIGDTEPLVFPYYGIYNVDTQQGFFCQDLSSKNDNLSALSSDEQYFVNVFLSNFSEQDAFEKNGFDINCYNIEDLVFFAEIFKKINQSRSLINTETVYDESYYVLERDAVNEILDRFLGIKITAEQAKQQLSTLPSSGTYADIGSHIYYMNDSFYSLAADGRRYLKLSIIDDVQKLDNNEMIVYFTIYSINPNGDYFHDNVDDSLYHYTSEQAANDEGLIKEKNGIAKIIPYDYNGTQTYRLINYVSP